MQIEAAAQVADSSTDLETLSGSFFRRDMIGDITKQNDKPIYCCYAISNHLQNIHRTMPNSSLI
jgi:hypothetical protein